MRLPASHWGGWRCWRSLPGKAKGRNIKGRIGRNRSALSALIERRPGRNRRARRAIARGESKGHAERFCFDGKTQKSIDYIRQGSQKAESRDGSYLEPRSRTSLISCRMPFSQGEKIQLPYMTGSQMTTITSTCKHVDDGYGYIFGPILARNRNHQTRIMRCYFLTCPVNYQ